MRHVTLARFCYSDEGTFGRLSVGAFSCYTVERPWRGNQPNVSCIPEGWYALKLRASGVVSRTSGYDQGYEVQDVLNRTYIMLHVGNTAQDVEGCIALGGSLGVVGGHWAVMDSRKTFACFMDAMGGDVGDIRIIQRRSGDF